MTYNNSTFRKVRSAGVDTDGALIVAEMYKRLEGVPGTAVANIGTLTAAASVGVPTKAEFDKVVADLATLRTAHNALLASLRTAGIIAP